MAAAARIHGIERGKDLRAYPLFAFGGAGPVHCWQVAKILRVPRILLPFGAGAMSAYGLLAAPLAFDFVRTRHEHLDSADWPALNRLLAEMEADGRERLARAGVAGADVRVKRVAEMRYLGQGHEVEATLPSGTLSDESLAAITSSFEAAYRMLYHRLPQGVPIEALNWRVTTAGPAPHVTMHPAATAGGGARGALKGTRRAWFPEADAYVDTPVYDRYALEPGAELSGPLIVEERESTAVVGPGGRCRIDAGLTLVVEL
jgi:N-methylhydantoinase A